MMNKIRITHLHLLSITNPIMPKRWNIAPSCSQDFVEVLGDEHPIIPQLLWNRGLREAAEAEKFFNVSFEEGVHDPFLFTQMKKAVERIFAAIEAGESITVFGDYDADGVTGSTVLITTIREIERKMTGRETSCVGSYIPHRDKEGYGLQMPSVEALAERKASLVITVDCGIACVNEIAAARERGMEVIVVDHHQFGETLPEAILIHPSLPGETYPFKSLAAVGVAWKLASALITSARERGLDIVVGFEKWLLDLVAIATITDVVPLVGENRVLETFGLQVLNKSRRPGLAALVERAGLTWGEITERDIGFGIGPRINAAGRMEHASVALELLLAATEVEALDLSHRVEGLNKDRQKATEQMMKQAEEQLAARAGEASGMIQVLWHPEWSPALVGLVAGRIADRMGMPTIAIGKHGDHWIGSGRSFPQYDITAAVKRCGEGLLTRSGGHVQACGFALAHDDHVPQFAERLHADAAAQIQPGEIGPAMDVDAAILLGDIDWKLVERLKQFRPFGCGNTEPLFVAHGVHVLSSAIVGKTGKHLRFAAKDPQSGAAQPFIAFNHGERVADVQPGARLDVAFHIGENEWNGRRDIQCKVVDFRQAEA
jgi:single-stranded-DNA-specific exonuclease